MVLRYSLCVAAKRYKKAGGGNEYRWTTRMCNGDEESNRNQFSVVCEAPLKDK